MADDLERAIAFIERHDMVGTRREVFPWGRAVFAPEIPLRHDSNYLLVDRLPAGADAAWVAALAERLQGGAGLGHRCVMIPDADAGERLAEGFGALGWHPFRGVVMAARRPPAREAPAVPVAEVQADRLRAARAREILRYPWATPEVARQLLDVGDLFPSRARHFAVFAGGEPASWIELYREDDVAQLEALATVERFRNRGYATALLLHGLAQARQAGARLVFLGADATDWPRRLYERLGFDEIGGYVKFTRPPAP